MLIDSHCHLDKLDNSHYPDGLSTLIKEAQEAGVDAMLSVSVGTEKFAAMLKLIDSYPFIYASAGQHPLNINQTVDAAAVDWKLLQSQAQNPKVIAIGETGLDYFYDDANHDHQQASFVKHMHLAQQTKKPLIVHTRSARQDTISLLKEHADLEVGGVIHCFTEDWNTAKACLDLGFYISISGIVTFNKATELKEVVKRFPLERLLVETDAPYLAPVPVRGKQNEPKYVRQVAQYVADLKGISLASLGQQTSHNFYQLFTQAIPPNGAAYIYET